MCYHVREAPPRWRTRWVQGFSSLFLLLVSLPVLLSRVVSIYTSTDCFFHVIFSPSSRIFAQHPLVLFALSKDLRPLMLRNRKPDKCTYIDSARYIVAHMSNLSRTFCTLCNISRAHGEYRRFLLLKFLREYSIQLFHILPSVICACNLMRISPGFLFNIMS